MDARATELLRYVRFAAADAAALRAFRDVARPSFVAVAKEFYERTREHEDAHEIFSGEEQIARLQSSLVVWMDRLLGGTYDSAYFAQTAHVGRVHVRVGLPPRYMPVAMGFVRDALGAIARIHLPADDMDRFKDALSKILEVELAIMLEAYREDTLARLARATALEREDLDRRAARMSRLYAAAVDLSHRMLVGLDAEGRIQLVNRHTLRVIGYANDETIGQSFAELLLPEDLRDDPESRAERFDTDRTIELTLRTRSGKLRIVRWQVARAPASLDDAVVVFCFGSDVTEESTARHRNQQQARLASIGTLAAGLAHEIRNPLNGAQLHVSFLARALAKSENADALEAVQVIDDEIKRLARLVTEFLDFARPRPLTRAATSLRAIVDRATVLVADRARAASVTLLRDLPTADIVFSADGGKVEQVLLNLLQNGIEAIGDRGGTITIRARREPHHVIVEVEDDGPGISGEGAPIFDAFFSTKAEGTGLGLAIVHRMVTDHGGAVDVESRPGRTRFRITLPLADPAHAEAAEPRGDTR